MPVPANFHGKKGRSGRKSTMEEYAKKEAIIKAWNKVNKELDASPVDKIALPLCLRDMTEKKDISGDININIAKDITDKYDETNADTSDNSEGQTPV
jgi:phosphopantetheinyl transferase (holo-ACP synthase)